MQKQVKIMTKELLKKIAIGLLIYVIIGLFFGVKK